MTLMCGGVALAVPVLRSLGVMATDAEIAAAASAEPPVVAQAAGVTVPPDDPALEASMTSFPSGTLQGLGYLARPKGGGPYPAVLIIHENRGLLEHFKDVAKIKAAVLAIYGELDSRLNAGIPEIRDAMQNARIVHEIVIFPGAQHAFFNDTWEERHNDAAARAAWNRTLAWFDQYLKGA